jgi:hypothetical protein
MVEKRTYACDLAANLGAFDCGKAETRRFRTFVSIGVTISRAIKRGKCVLLEERSRGYT